MDRQKFIEQFQKAQPGLDMDEIDKIINGCLDRCHDNFISYEWGHMNLVSAMEEMGELMQAISQRMRGRTNDNYDILQESADVITSIWCICQVFGITHEDLQKAINVKMEREAGRILEHELDSRFIDGAYWDDGQFNRPEYLTSNGKVPDHFHKYEVGYKAWTINVWARNQEEAMIIADTLAADA